MATATATWARAAFEPLSSPGHNILPVSWAGALSDSGSGLVLLAKIPVTARNVQWIGVQNAGATGQAINASGTVVATGQDATFASSSFVNDGTGPTVLTPPPGTFAPPRDQLPEKPPQPLWSNSQNSMSVPSAPL